MAPICTITKSYTSDSTWRARNRRPSPVIADDTENVDVWWNPNCSANGLLPFQIYLPKQLRRANSDSDGPMQDGGDGVGV